MFLLSLAAIYQRRATLAIGFLILKQTKHVIDLILFVMVPNALGLSYLAVEVYTRVVNSYSFCTFNRS